MKIYIVTDIQSGSYDKELTVYHNIPTTDSCRVCGSGDMRALFSLGVQYVSDFIDDGAGGVKCPIDIHQCENCSLVQNRYTAPQEILYSRHYWYRSGVTDTMRAALRDVAEAAESRVSLKPGDVVLDIGSNDGTLLRSYTVPGIVRVGCEPAENLQEEGKKGVDILITDFWSYENYVKAQGIQAFGRDEEKDGFSTDGKEAVPRDEG